MKTQQLYELVWMSRPLMQAAEARVEKGLEGTDLTVRMRAVLEILRSDGDLAVPDIAARLQIKRQYVQLMVNETLASGFTEQLPNPRHKRSVLLRLTEKGRTLIDDAITREMDLMQAIGTDFSAEDVSVALKVVQAVTSKLNEHEESMP